MTWLIAAVAATAAGCAAPLSRSHSSLAHSNLAQRDGEVRTLGVLPPAISMYEEQFRNKLVPHGDWSREASEAVGKAFVEEMTAGGLRAEAVGTDDPELNEMADLFRAVDFSIARHVFGDRFNETFPAKAESFDYSLGPAAGAMERSRVDAVWIVAGVNLLPTAGTQVADAVDVLMQVAGGIGRVPVGSSILTKLDLRAALVGRDGTVLFFCRLGSSDVAVDDGPVMDDLRQPGAARRYARALIAEYRKATAR